MAVTALVGVIMGSRSDWETLRHTAETLERLGIAHELGITIVREGLEVWPTVIHPVFRQLQHVHFDPLELGRRMVIDDSFLYPLIQKGVTDIGQILHEDGCTIMSHEEWSNLNGTRLTREQKMAFNQLTWYLHFDMAADIPKSKATRMAPLPKDQRTLKARIPDLKVILTPEWDPPEPEPVQDPIHLDITSRARRSKWQLATARYIQRKKVRAVHAHEQQHVDTDHDGVCTPVE